MSPPARLLTIAGSDSGGGAGIQADLKTFAAHGGYGMSVVTAITAQNTLQVTAVHEVPAAVVGAQIDAVFEDIGVDAVKIGMLSSAEIIGAVAAGLRRHRGAPVVLDPVMVAKSGDALLRDDAVAALTEELLPLATVVTPNLPEARRLTGLPTATPDERRRAARQLAAAGPAVLLKGGHGDGPTVTDLLFDGNAFHTFDHPRQATRSTHGTGCTLSAALAARLGAGPAFASLGPEQMTERLVDGVEGAIRYLQGAMAAAFPLGAGHGPVHHLFELFRP